MCSLQHFICHQFLKTFWSPAAVTYWSLTSWLISCFLVLNHAGEKAHRVKHKREASVYLLKADLSSAPSEYFLAVSSVGVQICLDAVLRCHPRKLRFFSTLSPSVSTFASSGRKWLPSKDICVAVCFRQLVFQGLRFPLQSIFALWFRHKHSYRAIIGAVTTFDW